MSLKKIAVFVSGGGSNLQALLDGIHGKYGEIALVISNNPHAYGLLRARAHHIYTLVINSKDPGSDDEVIHALLENNIDLIVLAGYLKILSPRVVQAYKNKIINIHPSLIPAFCGNEYYGIKVHEKVYEYGVKITGATVHFVDEGTDTGPIIMQRAISIGYDDDPKCIQQKVLEVEHAMLQESLRLICQDKLIIEGRRVKIIS
ncbi:MAG: phosphoribosylglycinamide formyltransferase [Eubacteriales bacterium]